MRIRAYTAIALMLSVLGSTSVAAEQKAPKLILQITVDQLRGDLPSL